ncbi:DUF4186 family protein [Agrobacterium tumefaciens]|nr:DUF4186 family protein [Agrobacterium tumefaciens]
MWSKPFDDAAKERVRKLGWEGTLVSIRQALRSSVGKAAGAYDGRQTKFERNVVFYAQHSTATCCRKCMKYWYDIPMDRALTEEEMGYCELVIRRYLEIRKPDMD